MSTFTHSNSHRADSDRRSRAFGAGLVLTLASGAAFAGGMHRFVFTAYSDAAGGAEVMAGRYRTALQELNTDAGSMALDPSALNTNRCVAFSMTLQWQQAHAACDAAVRAASMQRVLPSTWWGPSHGSDDDYLALAYTNRAVLEWMSSDQAAARKDLAEAQGIAPQSGFVTQNLAALAAHAEIAQASSPVPRS